ncbi:MAG: peptide-methionine (R)-S-oxide reductase MsrB [Alphaproteobacteria bacterium]|jgi:peptide-methionine (R)-S-oxide reductase
MADEKIVKSDEEWRAQLSPEAYQVTRKHGTERPFTGEYNACKEDGIYRCTCCGNPLFDAAHKFDSGTGWPSYWQPVAPDAVAEKTDRSLFMTRTEILCAKCDAHLGHVFPDGPQPTGLRYCMNSVALDLDRDAKKEAGE